MTTTRRQEAFGAWMRVCARAVWTVDRDGNRQEVVLWTEAQPDEAVEALAAGLCHAVAMSVDTGADVEVDVRDNATVAVVVLAISRSGPAAEVLVVPSATFDSSPIAALRALVDSAAVREPVHDGSDDVLHGQIH